MSLKSLPALAEAIAAVKKEAGDAPEHKALLASLTEISKDLGEDSKTRDSRDNEDDDYSFATAEKRHAARNAESTGADKADKAEPAAVATAGDSA